MRFAARAISLAVLFGTITASSAYALKFQPLDDGFGRRVLLIADCGNLISDYVMTKDDELVPSCTEPEESFTGAGPYADPQGNEKHYRGDAQVLREYLSNGRFDEVWLFSGGGNLNEGIRMGNTLRTNGIAVRVPNGTRLRKAGRIPARPMRCVSACTVTFMGGVLRFVDSGATYEVHSSSSAMAPNARQLANFHELIDRRGFSIMNDWAAEGTRQMAADLFSLFQDALWLPLGNTSNERLARNRVLADWVTNERRPVYPADELQRDSALFTLEGDAMLQDVVMKMERRALNDASTSLRGLAPRLGRRAELALDMLDRMFDVSIVQTFSLTNEAMITMGYVTPEISIRK